MKNCYAKTLAFIFFLLIPFFGNSQTNVSGGIFADETWTLANSPYIVTGNVVVFPTITLTIEPGVLVKFNSGVQLELRQARLLALGTNSDSITFTSNTSSIPGSWDKVLLNGGDMISRFAYCNFRYAATGLYDNATNDSLIVQHCDFRYNTTGLYGQGNGQAKISFCNFRYNTVYGVARFYRSVFSVCDFSYNQTGFDCHSYNTLNNCAIHHNQTGMSNMRMSTVRNCMISHNQTGILIPNQGVLIENSVLDSNTVIAIDVSDRFVTIDNCQLRYNMIAVNNHNNTSWPSTIKHSIFEYNFIGIQLANNSDSIYCNKICNNTTYNLYYTGINNVNVTGNYWCAADSASASYGIYDGYDNTGFGLADFIPIDNSECYLTTGMPVLQPGEITFGLYPNPASGLLTISLSEKNADTEIRIFSMPGELISVSRPAGKTITIDVSSLSGGIYFVQVTDGGKTGRQKFIRE